MKVIPHPYRDHMQLTIRQLTFGDDSPIVMTEKDAVKCAGMVLENCWYVPVTVKFPNAARSNWLEELNAMLEQKKEELCPSTGTSS
jgi:tetraacyldisaccharide 4'-kinase